MLVLYSSVNAKYQVRLEVHSLLCVIGPIHVIIVLVGSFSPILKRWEITSYIVRLSEMAWSLLQLWIEQLSVSNGMTRKSHYPGSVRDIIKDNTKVMIVSIKHPLDEDRADAYNN